MELKEHLKEHRNRLGLSQEDVAERIFVSRQTISNWETDRTYPDVQSLLLLSEIFGTSIDELVKGDVATMEKAIENDWKTMSRLTVAAWALVGVGLVCVAVGFAVPTAPSSLMPKCTESEVLGIVLFLALWVLGCILLGMVESMKKKYDLVTYRDIVAYSRGEEPVRDNEAFGRKHPVASAGLKMGGKRRVGVRGGLRGLEADPGIAPANERMRAHGRAGARRAHGCEQSFAADSLTKSINL